MNLQELDHWHLEHQPELEVALQGLKALHERTIENPGTLSSADYIVSLLGQESRENNAAFVELMQLKSEIPLAADVIDEERKRRALAVLYHHYGYSRPGYPIKTMQMGQLRTQQYLEACVNNGNNPSALRNFGLLMVDVNGMKAVKECIGHDGTNEFLRNMSKLFADKNGTSRTHLEKELGTKIMPLVAGGDEFAFILEGENDLDQGILQKTVHLYEQEVAQDPVLRSSLNFDNEHALMNRAGWTEVQKKHFLKNRSPEDVEKLKNIRASLPESFVPSISGGGVTCAEGIAWAMHQHDDMRLDFENETSFTKACNKIFHGMFLIAEQRQHARKLLLKQKLLSNDRKQGLFLTRTKEAQALEEQISNIHSEIERLIPDLQEVLIVLPIQSSEDLVKRLTDHVVALRGLEDSIDTDQIRREVSDLLCA